MTRLHPSFRLMVSRKDLGESLVLSDTLGDLLPISLWTQSNKDASLLLLLLTLLAKQLRCQVQAEKLSCHWSTYI